MQKPLQEYIRGMYGGYLSEATRKRGGDSMDLQSVPLSANPLDLALKLTKTEQLLPKPLSLLPEYVDPTALNAIRAMLSVPLSAGGLGAEIKQPTLPSTPSVSSPTEMVAQTREKQVSVPEQPRTAGGEGAQPTSVSKPSSTSRTSADIRSLWTQINALGMNIPDAKRRHAFIANEIERLRAEGEVDEGSASTLHNWNNSINAPQEEKGIDDRLLWLLMIASMFQR